MSYESKRGADRGDRAGRDRLFERRRTADQADFGHRSEPAPDLRTDRQPAEPARRLRPAQGRDAARPDLRAQPALAAAGRVGRHVPGRARTADAAAPHPVARAADPEEHRQPDLRLRGAQGLSDARRQGAAGRQEPDRVVVRARLGGARLSGRALRARTHAAARPSRGDARHGSGQCAQGLAQRTAGRAGAGHAHPHARRRARLYAPEVRGAQRRRSGLDRRAARRSGHGARVRGRQRRQSRHRAGPRLLHLRRLHDLAARPHADDRRHAAEGELGARDVRRSGRRQAAVREPVSGHPCALQQGFHLRVDSGDEQSAVEVAARRQAEICQPRRRFRADLADQAALRIDPRRDGPDARAAEGRDQRRRAAGQAGRAAGWAC